MCSTFAILFLTRSRDSKKSAESENHLFSSITNVGKNKHHLRAQPKVCCDSATMPAATTPSQLTSVADIAYKTLRLPERQILQMSFALSFGVLVPLFAHSTEIYEYFKSMIKFSKNWMYKHVIRQNPLTESGEVKFPSSYLQLKCPFASQFAFRFAA